MNRTFLNKACLLIAFLFVVQCHAQQRLLLLDTIESESYRYQPFISMAEAVGFEVKYMPISKIMDTDLEVLISEPFDAALFLLSIEFLNKQQSPISEKYLKLMEIYSYSPLRLIGLVFPSGIDRGMSPFSSIFKRIGINIKEQNISVLTQGNYKLSNPKEQSVLNFIKTTDEYLSKSIIKRGITYDTMIFTAHKQNMSFDNNNNLLLPKNKYYLKDTQNLFPLAIKWKNPYHNNTIFITSQHILGFSSISEDFRTTPSDFNLRKNILNAIQETISHLSNEPIKAIKDSVGRPINNAKNITCPWIDIGIFGKPDKEKEQNQLIKYITDSNFTHLWLSIAPNWYYSPIATLKKHTDSMKLAINTFTKKLKISDKPIPKILIGFEIANNLRDNNIPYKNMAYDIYGNAYKDAPAPLNKTFWQEEIVIPLKKFTQEWNKYSNNIPISGVMLDLEMYVKSSGTFLSTMGFDEETLNKFGTSDINTLINNKKLSSYFSFLKNEAEKLGSKLKSTFEIAIPNCTLGCYAPNISTDWFYKGFYKGLSKNKPIMLLTFNAEINSHKNWLKNNSINIKHIGALMLSKIQSEKDLIKIPNLLKHHHGIWLNRFSTLVDKYTVYPEHTPLSKNPCDIKKLTNQLAISKLAKTGQ